jgi:hypothetical protein
MKPNVVVVPFSFVSFATASVYPFDATRTAISESKKTIPSEEFGWTVFAPGRGEDGREEFVLPNTIETVDFFFRPTYCDRKGCDGGDC